MAGRFVDQVSQGKAYDISRVEGYSKEELGIMEQLYDIKITGYFRQFLLEMGRCSGGLIGDDRIILYNKNIHIKDIIFLEIKMNNYNRSRFDNSPMFLGRNIFILENRYNYYFIRTKSENPDLIFCYNPDSETIGSTEMDFLEYIKNLVRNDNSKEICRGDIVTI